MLQNLNTSLSKLLLKQISIFMSTATCRMDSVFHKIIRSYKVEELIDLIRFKVFEVDFITISKLYYKREKWNLAQRSFHLLGIHSLVSASNLEKSCLIGSSRGR